MEQTNKEYQSIINNAYKNITELKKELKPITKLLEIEIHVKKKKILKTKNEEETIKELNEYTTKTNEMNLLLETVEYLDKAQNNLLLMSPTGKGYFIGNIRPFKDQ